MKKSDKLKQIHKELIKRDFYLYWQKTGVNARLLKYERIQNLVEFFVIMIDILLYLYCLYMIKDLIVSLLERTGYFFENFTIIELIEAISINMLNLAVTLTIIYMALLFVGCIGNHRLLRYEIIKPFKMLLYFYVGLITIMFSLDFILKTYIFAVILLLIKYAMNKFIRRVNVMEGYATGKIREAIFVCCQEGIGIK